MLRGPLLASVLAALATAAAAPAAAIAETCTFNGSDWHTPAHWTDCTGIPNADDDVVIPALLTATVSSADATANSVDLKATGALTVANARTLAIDGGAASTFAGAVEVLDQGSVLRHAGVTTGARAGGRSGASASSPTSPAARSRTPARSPSPER